MAFRTAQGHNHSTNTCQTHPSRRGTDTNLLVARRTVNEHKAVTGASNGNCVTKSNVNVDLVQVRVRPAVDGSIVA